MIHLKIKQIGDKIVVELSDADMILLGASVGDTVSVVAREPDPINTGKAFVERYSKTFSALAK